MTLVFDSGASAVQLAATVVRAMARPRFIAAILMASLLPACEVPTATTNPTWIAMSILDRTHLHEVTFGDGIWIVAAQHGKLALSSDLQRWTEVATHWTSSDDVHDVHFANGVFVAAGTDRAGLRRYLATSDNGLNWTRRSLPVEADRLGSIHYSERLDRWFVAGRWQNRPVFVSSTNLEDWILVDAAFGDDPIISIAEGHDMLVVSGGSEKIGTSQDGVHWFVHQLGHTSEAINDIDRVRYYDGVFLAILHPDASTTYRSTDAKTWTPVTTGWPPREPSCRVSDCPGGLGGWVSIAERRDRMIIAVGLHGKMMSTRDTGITWAKLSSPVQVHLNGIFSDGIRFVAVGNDGTLLVSR